MCAVGQQGAEPQFKAFCTLKPIPEAVSSSNSAKQKRSNDLCTVWKHYTVLETVATFITIYLMLKLKLLYGRA